MFITRATRRDGEEIKQFYRSQNWSDVDPNEGVAFIARQGPIVGCARLLEADTNHLVIVDVVVHPDHRGAGVGEQLVQALMSARGGVLYAPTTDEAVGFYEQLGFKEIGFDDLPQKVRDLLQRRGDVPDIPGALSRYMKGR